MTSYNLVWKNKDRGPPYDITEIVVICRGFRGKKVIDVLRGKLWLS